MAGSSAWGAGDVPHLRRRGGGLWALGVLLLSVACSGDKAADSGDLRAGEVAGADGAGAGADGTGSGGGESDGSGAEGDEGTGDDGSGSDEDGDGDGFPASEDCDDRDPLTHPGAAEEWNAIDDDCDGRVDANGCYSGVLDLSATAIYEGLARSYTLSCPGEIERTGPALVVEITCTPEPTDELAVLLLGESLRITLAADDASGAEWSGRLAVDGGTWSSTAAGTITFVDLRDPRLTLEMDTVSLDLTGAMSTVLVEED